MKFKDIAPFTCSAVYAVDVSIDYFPEFYARMVLDEGLNVYPEFQRGFVWTQVQKIRYIEFILRGGNTGRDIYCNCPGWNRCLERGDYVLVDGKQRTDAILGFLNNEFPVFGNNYRKDFSDKPNRFSIGLKWHVNDLETYDEVLQWYIDLNDGGTVHPSEEIERVRGLIGNSKYTNPSKDELIKLA